MGKDKLAKNTCGICGKYEIAILGKETKISGGLQCPFCKTYGSYPYGEYPYTGNKTAGIYDKDKVYKGWEIKKKCGLFYGTIPKEPAKNGFDQGWTETTLRNTEKEIKEIIDETKITNKTKGYKTIEDPVYEQLNIDTIGRGCNVK